MFDYDNFTYKDFIDYVMKKMKLEDTEPQLKKKIEKEIVRTLGHRVLTTIMNAMSDEDMLLYDSIKNTNPDLTEYGALYAMIDEVPALHEVMMKSINDLAEELTYDSERLDIVLKEKKKQKTKTK